MKKLLIISIGIFLAFQVGAQQKDTYVTINAKVLHGDPSFARGPGSGWLSYEYYNPYSSGYHSQAVSWGLNSGIVQISTAKAGHINFYYSPDNVRMWGCCANTSYCWKFLFWETDRKQTIYFSKGQTGVITVSFVATPTHFHTANPGN